MNWKTVIAAATMVFSMSYCTIELKRSDVELQLACMQLEGNWSKAWGGQCKLGNEVDAVLIEDENL